MVRRPPGRTRGNQNGPGGDRDAPGDCILLDVLPESVKGGLGAPRGYLMDDAVLVGCRIIPGASDWLHSPGAETALLTKGRCDVR
jgi:hypothetical protein